MNHPFGDTIRLHIEEQRSGHSVCSLEVVPGIHHNPHQVAHGAVLYALADTGMGAALYPSLAGKESCATIEIKISYFKPVKAGVVRCVTEMLNRGRAVAALESRLYVGDSLVAHASGHYAIIRSESNQEKQ